MRLIFYMGAAVLVLAIVIAAASCAPTPNKLAPEPPYAGDRPWLERAEYLRVEELLDAD